MLLIRLLLLPFRLVWGTTKVSAKTGYRVGHLLGYRRMFVFGVGVGVGLLVAPTPGRELRAKLQEALAGAGIGPGSSSSGGGAPANADLGERVRQHVRQAPRTWHLPQPVVTEVTPGRVRLDGEVADDAARRDLETTVSQVDGVVSVDNRVTVSSAPASPSSATTASPPSSPSSTG